MKRFLSAAALIAVLSFTAFSATAHPGSKILTTGSGERAAMTAGVTYEDVNGVHIFRGTITPAKEPQHAAERYAPQEIRIEITMPRRTWRCMRGLRTQGFYSGKVYPSRPYTQGFYSGR